MEEVASEINTCLPVDFKMQRIYSGLSGWVHMWSQRPLIVDEGERKDERARGKQQGKGDFRSCGIRQLLEAGKDKIPPLEPPESPARPSILAWWNSGLQISKSLNSCPLKLRHWWRFVTAGTEISYKIWAAFITVWNLSWSVSLIESNPHTTKQLMRSFSVTTHSEMVIPLVTFVTPD